VRPRYGRLIFAVVVLATLAGIYAGAGAIHPAAAAGTSGRASRAAVSTATRLCPAPGSAAPTAASVAVAAMPASAGAGRAVITRLVPGGNPATGPVSATDSQPGVLQVSAVKTAPQLTKSQQSSQPGSSANVTTQDGRGGIAVSAAGAMAQGLDVEQTGPGGLATAQCGAPGTDFWFVGPGQAMAGTIELYLMNPGSQPADAAVSVLTDATKGPPLLGNADNGITVPPHGMVVQSLSRLVQTSKVIALNITTSVGQVVAAVRESKSASREGGWLPPAQAPSRHLVIPGLPSGTGSRDLYIAVPGSASAQVKITAVTAKGSYQPTGGTGPYLGGSVVAIRVPSLDGVSGAIEITASVPVAATLEVPGGAADTPGALAVSAAPIGEQGVLAANPARSAGSTDLVLSAPQKAASVRIATASSSVSALGQQGTVVQIKARSSVIVKAGLPRAAKPGLFALVVTPLSGSGPVYAGRVITSGGSVQSILPVPPSPTWISLPAVQQSLSAILG
jgi:Family of unknown function (DUF5719)